MEHGAVMEEVPRAPSCCWIAFLVREYGNVPNCKNIVRCIVMMLLPYSIGVQRAACMQVICHLAERLVELHASGIVHRDLKPANVMWLPSQNRWTIIDFGCAARTHSTARLAYTLRYAAPEVIAAKRKAGLKHIVVEESLDAWSLGVMAFEMATGAPGCAFQKGTPPNEVHTTLLLCYNRKAEVEQEPQKIKQGRNLKSCAFTRMAQQHHQESLSQLF